MHNGTAPDCLTSQTLLAEGFVPGDEDCQIGQTLTELDIAYAVSSPFGAGIDTVRMLSGSGCSYVDLGFNSLTVVNKYNIWRQKSEVKIHGSFI